MLPTLLKKFFIPPSLAGLSLKSCRAGIRLDGLRTGVDNIRHDVHLSEGFRKAAHDLVLQVIAKHTRADDILNLDKSSSLPNEKERFGRLSSELLTDAINKAKLANQPGINILAQVAAAKFLLKEIRACFEILTETCGNAIREYDIANKRDRAFSLKNRLSNLIQTKDTLSFGVCREVFQYFADIQQDLNEMRRINFGSDSVLPNEMFRSPMLYVENPSDDVFMIEEYDILLGHRMEDPDRYESLAEFLVKGLAEIHAKDSGDETLLNEEFEKTAWEMIGQPDNVDVLFNLFESRHQAQLLKKKKSDPSEIRELNEQADARQRRLNFFHDKFVSAGIMDRIVALYEMRDIYSQYCPPLVPQVVLQYLISARSRKEIGARLERSKRFYSKAFSANALEIAAKRVGKAGKSDRLACLMRFLKAFFRYHRDFRYLSMLELAMKSVHLAVEDKIIQLSRANNTLYEFMLPHEHVNEEKPIVSHVIVKADVRGSTDITHLMTERGLNPASYFSLNLFDPITDILSEYDASKVFVEGDAIILSVFEREETPEGWYSVARACGLAVNILSIVRRYNARNREYQLPIIELGIGISFREGKPMFLFDGTSKIMISPAINLADRLSGCSKELRHRPELRKGHFNLYVFQTLTDEEVSKTADDLSLRYNVDGIELNENGFEKLRKEIRLKFVPAKIPSFGTSKTNFHVGKFPTKNGEYRTLVIRESPVPHIHPETFRVVRMTSRNYYEICTNPKIIENLERIVFGK